MKKWFFSILFVLGFSASPAAAQCGLAGVHFSTTNDMFQMFGDTRSDRYDTASYSFGAGFHCGSDTLFTARHNWTLYTPSDITEQNGDPTQYASWFTFSAGVVQPIGDFSIFAEVGVDLVNADAGAFLQNAAHTISKGDAARLADLDALFAVPDSTHFMFGGELAYNAGLWGGWTVRPHVRARFGYVDEAAVGIDLFHHNGGQVGGWNPVTHASEWYGAGAGWYSSLGASAVWQLDAPYLARANANDAFFIFRGERGYQFENGLRAYAGVSLLTPKFATQTDWQSLVTAGVSWRF